MNIRAALLICAVATQSACAILDDSTSRADAVAQPVTGTDQAMEAFLAGRDLDKVEGAWEHDNSDFEFVIARNDFAIAPDYDYVGVITLPDGGLWNQGDVKVLLRNTDEESVYDGIWVTRNKAKRRMTFVVEHQNLIQASFVSNDGNTYFLRIRRVNPRMAGTL